MNESDKTDSVRAYYNDRVPRLDGTYANYRWEASAVRREHYVQTRDRLHSELSTRRFGDVVEVGCGPLVWTPLLAVRARRVIALDLSYAMLTDPGARQLPSAFRCCADASRLPLGVAVVDAVCTVRAFEYFPDKPAVIREFARVLRPGGYLMIVTKNREYRGYADNGRVPRMDPDKQKLHSTNVSVAELLTMVRAGGFVDVRLRPVIVGRTNWIPVWKVMRWAVRVARPHWPDGIPRAISGLVESVMIVAQRRSE